MTEHRRRRRSASCQAGQGTIEYVLIIGVIALVMMNLLMIGKFLLDRVVTERIKTTFVDWNRESEDYSSDDHHEGTLPPCGFPMSPPACEP